MGSSSEVINVPLCFANNLLFVGNFFSKPDILKETFSKAVDKPVAAESYLQSNLFSSLGTRQGGRNDSFGAVIVKAIFSSLLAVGGDR